MARLIDVARASGVSRSTVSNVYNNPERVSADVRERVLAAAERLAYGGPDPVGRLLRAGKVNAIGVVVRNNLTYFFDDEYMRELMLGIADVCDEMGISVLLAPAADTKAAERTIGNALVDGLILHSTMDTLHLANAAGRRRLPLVVVDFDPAPDIRSVRIDFRAATKRGMAHLLGLGHAEIAILSLPMHVDWAPRGVMRFPARLSDRDRRLTATYAAAREEIRGCADALAEAGLSIDDLMIVESTNTNDGAAEGAALLLDAAPRATAVFAMSFPQGRAILREAHRRGIAVPEELSVISFDNPPEAAEMTPPLTTVAQPTREKGRMAARLLFDDGPPRREILSAELMVRASTAPPRTGP
jgi:DNA-binding LacI/PurR family transcriptional regulator